MRRSAQIKENTSSGTRQYFSGPVDKEGKPVPTVSSNQRLSKNQIFTFWAGSLLMLIASFIIGFKAGQKIGAKEILDQAANQIVRLPIVRPIGRESETVSLAKLESSSTKKEQLDNKDKSNEDRKLDFTSQSESSGLANYKNFDTEKKPVSKLDTTSETTANSKSNSETESRYEAIYPGKDKFAPPGNSKKEEKKVEAPIIIDPIKPPPEKPSFNVDAYKPSPGWYVQIYAVPSLPEVENLHSKISSKNLPFKVESASIRNRPYYRILVGPFADRAAALEKRIAAKTQAGTPGEPFIRQVK